MGRLAIPDIRLITMTALGPFSWRWPDAFESFERGWAAVVTMDGQEFHIRHGIGRRNVYGRSRVHSVTWVEGNPTVEGVESDDFDRSASLLSLIKTTKRHLRPGDTIPPDYASFPVVVMAEEVRGPYSPRSLAVKLRQEDIDGWARHALLRAVAWDRLPKGRRNRLSLPPVTGTGPAPASVRPHDDTEVRAAVVAALLKYAGQHRATPQTPAVDFTPDKEANEFIRTNSFAFLVGVLFDQGVSAERAWQAPWHLRQRLGHLDPERIAADESAVLAAINSPPKLHRYTETMPRWLVLAARRVLTDYDGDAGAIWSDQPSADELQARLDAFVGIGQKKAAMAVEILERDLGVQIKNLERSDVAYDVHLRRVFLRTRLADRDDRDHMIAVARELHPTRPGELDLPSWLIGRGWCRPGVPNCVSCPLTHACPKDIERAAQVASA
ncbi:hypothetical protein [Microbispora sp. H11081]|uniref:hypothetical protein n=1 Tax=Microbispora sp. H11081 TaxID=2729107 RepID=UPI001474FAE6|nr:hypothetical protein [Microbispora sp. H11081]